MELFSKRIEYAHDNSTFNLIFIGDIHLGHGSCDIPKLTKTINKVKNMSNTYVFLMGDHMECISPLDKRFDAYSIKKEYLMNIGRIIDEQFSQLINLLQPIKNKIMLIHEGNHESNIRKKYFRDITLDLCRLLRNKKDPELPFYGRYSAITKLKFHHKAGGKIRTINILTTHGTGFGRLKGSKLNTLSNIATNFSNISLFVAGHSHERMIVPGTKLIFPNRGKSKLEEEEYLLVNSGTFLKTYESGIESYTETKMYPPNSLGCCGIKIIPATRKMEGFYL